MTAPVRLEPRARVAAAASGACAGAVIAFVVSELGIPHIFGLTRLTMLVPLLIAGALIGSSRYLKKFLVLAIVSVVFLLVIAYTGIVRVPARALIRSDPLPASADAIVVLSAGVTLDGMLPQQGMDRLIKGLELAKSGIATRLIMTRELRMSARGWLTSAADQNRLIALAGNPDVIFTRPVASTRHEAMRVAALAKQRGWNRIILVTSPFHSRRACATFEATGLLVTCVPSDSRDIAVNHLDSPDNRLRAFGMWIYEIAGTLRYRQAGWI